MSEIITYSLYAGQENSRQYYRDVAAFTDETLADAEQYARASLDAFQKFVRTYSHKAPRTQAECALELLTLGVLWRVYGGQTSRSVGLPQRVLAGLAEIRRRSEFLKPAADLLRGWLATLFLLRAGNPRPDTASTLENLEHLLVWLKAAGDFPQEVKRLEAWRAFLAAQGPEHATRVLNEALILAGRFEVRSLEMLGGYTPRVEAFLSDIHPAHRWREDMLFTGRQRVEYHLNMVGVEILNRAYREAFLETVGKVVILPPCMRAKPEEECKAKMTPFGERCAACTPSCHVHQATKLGEKYGFDVFMMPHELSVFSDSMMKPAGGKTIGVVGISCPLTNMTGGWEMQDLGVPAQGVLLDYCGCSSHWHKDGIPTGLNSDKMLEVLNIKEAS